MYEVTYEHAVCKRGRQFSLRSTSFNLRIWNGNRIVQTADEPYEQNSSVCGSGVLCTARHTKKHENPHTEQIATYS